LGDMVQRYYASSYGRFNTVDPLQSSATPNNPVSWNRYAYVGGDPVNLLDPRGMEASGCGPDWTTDPSLSGPCCPPGGDSFLPDPSASAACYSTSGIEEDGAAGGNSAPPPPTCEQLLSDAITTFLTAKGSPLAGDVSQIMSVAQTDKIDPTLIAAMAIAENGQYKNNPFGLGPNGSNTYTTLNAAVSAVGANLDKYIYTWNESTVSMLWSGNTWKVNPKKRWITTQPPGYCVGTTADGVASCQNTGTTISGFMKSMGVAATVGGNPNSLGFPCKD